MTDPDDTRVVDPDARPTVTLSVSMRDHAELRADVKQLREQVEALTEQVRAGGLSAVIGGEEVTVSIRVTGPRR